MDTNPGITVFVFFISGILGGIVGYLMNNSEVKWRKIEFLKSLIFGILTSGAAIALLVAMYSELFIPTQETMLNLVLAGCICFMISVVFLMFAYRFLMRLTSVKKTSKPLRIRES
ncbi:YEATS-associated helix-containing protein [Flavobacterium sp.]|uniref:YEATS-associated helix-containing protein n=1 Tax=Flavobacterium sp. TaxID=239 RepID=UPI00121A99C2|nr:YEATS-associated helix-containing protein [Flavobacterium sp.]RZJ70052.1 MAG: hypothetical protein EOO49_15475 [Flavobacterium sp.]